MHYHMGLNLLYGDEYICIVYTDTKIQAKNCRKEINIPLNLIYGHLDNNRSLFLPIWRRGGGVRIRNHLIAKNRNGQRMFSFVVGEKVHVHPYSYWFVFTIGIVFNN